MDATRAADRIEQAVRELQCLTGNGYGNNVCSLIELLQRLPESHEPHC